MIRPELRDLPTPNWFHHGDQILALLDARRPIECVELGSNRGCSAIAVARMIRSWGGRLTCVDQWLQGPSEVEIGVFAENIVTSGVSTSIRMIRAKTVDAATYWNSTIDYLYIDADHTKEGCTLDLENWWPFLRVGGLIAGDDYDDVAGDPVAGVTAAWDEFEARHSQTFRRTPTPGFAGRLIWGLKQ